MSGGVFYTGGATGPAEAPTAWMMCQTCREPLDCGATYRDGLAINTGHRHMPTPVTFSRERDHAAVPVPTEHPVTMAGVCDFCSEEPEFVFYTSTDLAMARELRQASGPMETRRIHGGQFAGRAQKVHTSSEVDMRYDHVASPGWLACATCAALVMNPHKHAALVTRARRLGEARSRAEADRRGRRAFSRAQLANLYEGFHATRITGPLARLPDGSVPPIPADLINPTEA